MKNNLKKKIVIGTWPISGDYGLIKISNIEKIINKCFMKKFYEYDTAPSYGNGFIESCLGNIFNGEKKIKINTKVGNMPFVGKNFLIDNMKKSIFQSLDRLKVDKINILFLHNPRQEINYENEKIFDFFEQLKSEKIIKYSGLSCAPNFIYNKNFLNFFDYLQDDMNLLKKTNLNTKNIYGRSVFANGILSGALNRIKKFDKDDHRSGWLNSPERKNSLLRRLDILKSYFKCDLKQLSFNYIFSNSNIAKGIFGVKKIEHINNLESMAKNFKKLKKDKMIIERLIENNFHLPNSEKKLGF